MSWVSVTLVSIAWQWLPSFDIGPLERQAKPPAREEHAPARTALADPAPAPATPVQLADDVVVRALDRGRAAFTSCWKRALAADPLLDATKVKLRIEVDADGHVRAVTHDAPDAKLGNCLAIVARGLVLPAPARAAYAEFPLFFRPE